MDNQGQQDQQERQGQQGQQQPQMTEKGMGIAFDIQKQHIDKDEAESKLQQKQLDESKKTPLDKAMDSVLSNMMQRDNQNKEREAAATAYFLDSFIKNRQADELDRNLAAIRKKSEARNLNKPLLSIQTFLQTDTLFNSKNINYTGAELDEDEEYRIAEENKKHYSRARDSGHLEYVREAKKCFAYYEGDQWNENDLATLSQVGRPALTINRILSIVNSIISLKLKESVSFIAQALDLAHIETAKVLTKLFLHVCNSVSYVGVENDVFKDAIITGRGFIEARVSFDENIEGDITLKRLNPEEVILDPDSSGNDPKQWQQVITTKWLSLNDIATQYGDKKAEQIKESVLNNDGISEDSYIYDDSVETFGDSLAWNSGDRDIDPREHKEIKCVRIISRQYKKMKNVACFADPSTKELKPVPPTWDYDKTKEFANKNNLFLMHRRQEAIRWTTSAGDVVLQDSWSPYKTFTVIPLFCYTAGSSSTFGVVQNLISPQQQLNKIESQETHVINSTANGGWVFEEDSLVNMNADELAEYGAKTGLVLEVKKNARSQPVKIQPNNVPPGLANASARSSENITSISGIDGAFLGIGKITSTSDASLQRKFNQVKDSYAVLNNQLRVAREIVGRKLLELIQEFYNDTRVFCISTPHYSDGGIEKVVINDPHPTEDVVINDISIGKYSVAIKNEPDSSSVDSVMFGQMMAMKEAGIAIPSYRLILASDLLDKDKIAQEVQKQEGLAPPSEEEEQMQQMQMQAEMEQMKLSLQKLQAEIQQITSNAMLNQAKAQTEQATPNLQLVNNQVKMSEVQMNSELRESLSDKTNQAEIVKTEIKSKAEIEKEMLRAKGSLDVEKEKVMGGLTSKYLSNDMDNANLDLASLRKIQENAAKAKADALYKPKIEPKKGNKK